MATSIAKSRAVFLAIRRDTLFFNFTHECRMCTHLPPEDHVKRPGFVKRYLVDKTVEIVTTSSSRLEKSYPRVFQMYKTFKTGLSTFAQESKEYYNVSKKLWAGSSLKDLSRNQLEILRQLPKDFVKIIPVLVLSFIPGGSSTFPVIFFFPRYLLSHHFWTEQQRQKFWRSDLKNRLEHLQPILDNMQLLSRHIDSPDMEGKVQRIVKKLQHAVHPTTSDILEVRPLFVTSPYNLERLSIAYVRHLAKMLQMSLRRKKLRHDAMQLHYTDMAMQREGFGNMTDFEIERACFWRGLNPIGLSRRDKVCYLTQWTEISKVVDEDSVSLLLHLPLLMSFWHPTNRELMGGWLFKFRRHRIGGPA